MADLIHYALVEDANRVVQGDVIKPPAWINAYVLTAGAHQLIHPPVGARVALFSSTNNFYVNWQAVAVVPTVNITTGAAPELNPIARDISDYDSFSIIAPADCVVTVAYLL